MFNKTITCAIEMKRPKNVIANTDCSQINLYKQKEKYLTTVLYRPMAKVTHDRYK